MYMLENEEYSANGLLNLKWREILTIQLTLVQTIIIKFLNMQIVTNF